MNTMRQWLRTKIGLPRAAAFRLEQRFMRLAEGAQAVVTGEHDPL